MALLELPCEGKVHDREHVETPLRISAWPGQLPPAGALSKDRDHFPVQPAFCMRLVSHAQESGAQQGHIRIPGYHPYADSSSAHTNQVVDQARTISNADPFDIYPTDADQRH